MKSAEILRGERLTLLDEAEALGQQAQSEDGLTDEQAERWDELTAEDGLIAMATANLEKQEAFEAKLSQIAKRRQADEAKGNKWIGGPVKDEPAADADKPAKIELKGQRSKHFADPREAYLAGRWFALATAPGREARDEARNELVRLGGDQWERYAAQSIGTDGKGGYLLPEPISTQIIKNRDAVGVAPQLCNVIGMTTETLRINEESGDATVYYPGESSAITASDVDWVQHTLTVTKRAALVKMSREFIADANVSAADQIIDNLGFRFAYAMDNEFINGDGTSTYGSETGLVSAVLAGGTNDADSGEDTIAELDVQDYLDTKATLPLKYQPGASWLMHPDAWYQLEALLMAAGGAATAEFAQALSGTRTFAGKPVFLSDLMPTPAASTFVAFYGDFRRAVAIGDRNDMSIETSTERYFETDDVAIRATHRYDILVHNAGDGSVPGAVVGLKLAS